MLVLLISTRNPGKLLEIKTILGDLPYELISLADFDRIETPAEEESTYSGNAIIKARSYAAQTGITALADDSGLEVEALGGAPGILSARYAGEGASDAARRALLISEIANRGLDASEARFVCAVAIARPDGIVTNVAEAFCSGRVIQQERGENGFGYDPLFVPDGYNLTFAELDEVVKNRISHRGKALAQTREFLLRDGLS